MSFLFIQSGVTSSGLSLSSGDQLEIASGGIASALVVNGGFVSVQGVIDGGSLSGDPLSLVLVYSGGLISGVVAGSGGDLQIESGGEMENVTAGSGATIAFEGFVASSGQTVNAGIQSATSAFDGAVFQSGAQLMLYDATVLSGAVVKLASGASVSRALVSAGGLLEGSGELLDIFGATQSSTVAGVISGISVMESSLLYALEIQPGGSALDLDLEGGGMLVDSGGYATGIEVGNQGALILSHGASLSAATVESGGVVSVLEAGDPDVGIIVSSGGSAILADVLISSGQTLILPPQTVQSTMTVSGVTVLSGGYLNLGIRIVLSGGTLYVPNIGGLFAGTVAAGGLISGSGTLGALTNFVPIFDLGAISAVTLSGPTAVSVMSGGLLAQVIVEDSVLDTVSAGGIARDNTILGQEQVFSGGLSLNSQIDGFETVYFGGALSGASLGGGAQLIWDPQATIENLTLHAGDRLVLIASDPYSAVVDDSNHRLDFVSGSQLLDSIGLAGGYNGFSFLPVSNLNEVLVTAKAADDFTGSGLSDILIQNTAGAVVLGQIGFTTDISYSQVGGLGPEWVFRGAGDLLGDGKSDILLQNTDGTLVYGQVQAGSLAYSAVLGGLGGEWSFKGIGDLLGDGREQILIQNGAGAVALGEVDAGQLTYDNVAALGNDWTFEGVGDYQGDGKAQALLRNANGALAVGEVSAGTMVYTQIGALGGEWTFEETADFLGDGKQDFLMENAAGALVVGEIQGGQATYTLVGALGSDWKFIGAGVYSYQGMASFLIQNANGALATGTVISGAAQYTTVGALGSDWSFHN